MFKQYFSKKQLFVFLFLSLNFCVLAQTDSVYTKAYLEKSTKFAWMTFGADITSFSGGKADYRVNGAIKNTSFGPTTMSRLTIGGIHFWGHTDFYVTFPLPFLAFRNTPNAFDDIVYFHGVETGARIYPLKLQAKRVSPFVGISFRSFSYIQQLESHPYPEDAPTYEQVIAPLQFGLTYTTKNALFTASAYYQTKNRFNYYITPTQLGEVKLEPFSFNISYLRYWDVDRSARNERGIQRLNLQHRVLEKENKLSDWYIGFGPSASLQLSKSSFLKNNYPYLNDDLTGGLMPDLTFGRYFYKPDMNVGLAYRYMQDQVKGYDTRIKLKRHAFTLESYKFLFNWLGFVPFAGVTASVEKLSVEVNGEQFEKTKPALGVVFGWDIRVTQTGTSLLRTNLRWSPNLHLDINGDKMMFDHLEFNFIQWVHFFGRKKAYQKHKK